MSGFTVGINEHTKLGSRLVQTIGRDLMRASGPYAIRCEKMGDILFFNCRAAGVNPSDADLHEQTLKEAVAAHIADIICRTLTPELVRTIISKECQYMKGDDRKRVDEHADRILADQPEGFTGKQYWQAWRQAIRRRILAHLESEDQLNVDGFIQFRLKDYMRELRRIAFKAIDDFLLEKEYTDFINLLRYFVEVQTPKIEEVHVHAVSEQGYLLTDGELLPIQDPQLVEMTKEMAGLGMNNEDLLISALLTLAPRKIVIHGKDTIKSPELTETICQVFEGRVKIEDPDAPILH